MTTYFLILATSVIVGLVALYIARRYKRNELGWFLGGMGLNLAGILAVFGVRKWKRKKQ